jgi:hypothetical protein
MRLPERAAGAEQTLDMMYNLVAEPDQPPPTAVCAGDTAKGEEFCGHAGQAVPLMNNPG